MDGWRQKGKKLGELDAFPDRNDEPNQEKYIENDVLHDDKNRDDKD